MITKHFYDDLAPFYKYIYSDWDASVKRQSLALESVIREFVGANAHTVLDVACGIGTQSIGLANLGYSVTASDISSGEIEQAKIEASRLDATISFQIADMCYAWDSHQRQFDVVIACDNSVPHLLSDDQILQAFKQFYQCTQPGGGCIITVRDYTQLERKTGHKQTYSRLVHSTSDGQIVMFDVWNFYDDKHYEITTYLVEDKNNTEPKTRAIRGGKYYCVDIPTLENLFLEARFRDVTTLKDRFFQPLLVAVK